MLMPAGTRVVVCDPDKVRRRAADLASAGREFLEASWTGDWVPAGRFSIRGRREKATAYTVNGGQPKASRWYGTPWTSRAERSAP